MKSILVRLDRATARLEEAAVFAILLGLVCTLALQVASRFVFKFPLAWTEELARIGLLWLVFIGSAVAARRAEHFAVELFMEKVPLPGKALIARAVGALVVAFFLVLAVIAAHSAHFGALQTLPALDISVAWATAAIPVGCALMSLHFAAALTAGASAGAKEGASA